MQRTTQLPEEESAAPRSIRRRALLALGRVARADGTDGGSRARDDAKCRCERLQVAPAFGGPTLTAGGRVLGDPGKGATTTINSVSCYAEHAFRRI